jgi:hypothetical protein
MRSIRLPLLSNHLERRDDRYLEGRAMSYSKLSKKVFVKMLPGIRRSWCTLL